MMQLAEMNGNLVHIVFCEWYYWSVQLFKIFANMNHSLFELFWIVLLLMLWSSVKVCARVSSVCERKSSGAIDAADAAAAAAAACGRRCLLSP